MSLEDPFILLGVVASLRRAILVDALGETFQLDKLSDHGKVGFIDGEWLHIESKVKVKEMVYLRFLVYRHSDLLQKHNVASYHLHYLFFILFQYQPILRQFPHLFQWFRASCVISCRILARIETHGQKHWHEMDQDDMYYSYFLFFFFCCCFLFVFVCFISFPLYYFIYLKMWLIPVDTRRCFNVYKTSVRRRRHLIDLW